MIFRNKRLPPSQQKENEKATALARQYNQEKNQFIKKIKGYTFADLNTRFRDMQSELVI